MILLAGVGCSSRQAAGERSSRVTIDCRQDIGRQVIVYREALEANPDSLSHQRHLAEAESAAAACHVERARAYETGRQPKRALVELESALRYVPTHPEAVTLRDVLSERIAESEQRAWEASAAAEQEQWREAFALADRALEIDASQEAARQVQARARDALVPQALAETREAIDAGRFTQAKALLTEIEILDAGNPHAQALRVELAERSGTQEVHEQPEPPPPIPPPPSRPPPPMPPQPLPAQRPRDDAGEIDGPAATEMFRIYDGWLSLQYGPYPDAWMMVEEGVTVVLDRTRRQPPSAYLEIIIGHEREIELRRQRPGSMFWFDAPSGRRYRFVLLAVDHGTETIRFAIDVIQ